MSIVDFSFPSSGDPEHDQLIAAAIRRQRANEAEGLCPNGCGPIREVDATTRNCPVCGFVGQCFTLSVGEGGS